MTPDELAAIRKRDVTFGGAEWGDDPHPAVIDRRALLAEVDRLTADLLMATDAVDDLHSRASEMYGDNLCLGDALAAAVPMERARIRAAVEALPEWECNCYPDDSVGGYYPMVVESEAILRSIEGEK